MYCRNCGKEIDDNASVCVHCGVAVVKEREEVDNGGFGWGVLGCCIPVAGLILFLVWKNSRPKTAKAAGIGALVSVGAVILLYVLLFIIGISASYYSF